MADTDSPDNVPLAAAPAAVPPKDTQPPIFEGSVSLWMGAKSIVVSVLLSVAGIGGAIYGATNSAGGLATPFLIGGIALLLASSIMLVYVILSIKCQRYKITRRLIEREQGLLFKRVDAIDLGRIKDVQLSQSFVDRGLNIGTIEVFSSDKTDPVMLIEAIPSPRPVYEQLRDAVIEISQRRGIVPMG
jgi:membrane protein YdbS with pleckstrin-like domain